MTMWQPCARAIITSLRSVSHLLTTKSAIDLSDKVTAEAGRCQHTADAVLVIVTAIILAVTVSALLADVVTGAIIGAGTATVFRFMLRTINPRR
ncbi:hypothetical protein [Rhodococcus sp. OK302]|uniref:hypothetical protein n=1 Tax=Rhodococcus sp. OK302 TaxID=1882769 RepID=UPI000B9F5CE4|nr:hypothetical protein [Rhodococcus sp. OK302]OYD70222.1 hypothetical protein BDB13_3819 [Rhodococcus sp. OK302]